MRTAFARNWRLIVLRGVLATLFGLTAFVWPDITRVVLITMFGIYALLDGLVAVGTSLSGAQDSPRRWAFLVEGLLSIAAAVVALVWPQLTGLMLVLVIAGWAILTGILEIVAAIRLRHEINNEWLLALGGIVSIALGVILFSRPLVGSIAIIWTVAAYAVIFGILLIALGFRRRSQNAPEDRRTLHSA